LHTAKRFKEFLNLPASLDLKANDDTVDIVGFLAFEMVRSLTIAGLEVKKSLEESYLRQDIYTNNSPVPGKRKHAGGLGRDAKRMRREESEEVEDSPLPVSSLFVAPPEARTSLRPEHIQDAFTRMQGDWAQRRSAGMRNWRGGLIRTTVTLI
jgi:transcription initiation protein SPT3